MKKSWIVKFIIFIVLLAAILYCTLIFFTMPHARDSACMYGWRLEPDNSLDVILIGPSGLYTSFYSPLAYEKEGFTSYALSVSGMSGVLYETALEEALAHHNPDLLIVDIKGFDYTNQYENNVLHKFLDTIPLTDPVRLNAIRTIVPEDERDLFWNPFLQYHGEGLNYKECARVFLDKITMRVRGYSITKNFSSQTDIYLNEGEKDFKIPEVGMELATSFLETCQEKGLTQVLFIRDPIPGVYNSKDSYYELVDRIEEAGYDFLDLYSMLDEIGLIYEHDWADDGHPNIYGAEKYTCFLADYVMSHYDINTEHSEEVKAEWDYCMSFNDSMISYLKRQCDEDEDEYHYTQRFLVGKGTMN